MSILSGIPESVWQDFSDASCSSAVSLSEAATQLATRFNKSTHGTPTFPSLVGGIAHVVAHPDRFPSLHPFMPRLGAMAQLLIDEASRGEQMPPTPRMLVRRVQAMLRYLVSPPPASADSDRDDDLLHLLIDARFRGERIPFRMIQRAERFEISRRMMAVLAGIIPMPKQLDAEKAGELLAHGIWNPAWAAMVARHSYALALAASAHPHLVTPATIQQVAYDPRAAAQILMSYPDQADPTLLRSVAREPWAAAEVLRERTDMRRHPVLIAGVARSAMSAAMVLTQCPECRMSPALWAGLARDPREVLSVLRADPSVQDHELLYRMIRGDLDRLVEGDNALPAPHTRAMQILRAVQTVPELIPLRDRLVRMLTPS